MVRWIAMWTGSIAAFVIFIIVSQLMLGDDRYPVSGDAGIKLAYTEDLKITGVRVTVDTTKNPSTIHFELVSDIENRQDYAVIALVLPYRGTLNDNSGWKWKPVEDSTLFVKKFFCTPDEPCSFADQNQFLDFTLDKQVDQKQSAFHSVRLWFFEKSPFLDTKVSSLVGQYNQERKPYLVGFSNLDNAKATVILDKTSDSFRPTPNAPLVPGPERNLQVDWDIQSGILHQMDWQIPAERNLANQMINYTALFGIALGITNLAIFGMEQRKRVMEARK